MTILWLLLVSLVYAIEIRGSGVAENVLCATDRGLAETRVTTRGLAALELPSQIFELDLLLFFFKLINTATKPYRLLP